MDSLAFWTFEDCLDSDFQQIFDEIYTVVNFFISRGFLDWVIFLCKILNDKKSAGKFKKNIVQLTCWSTWLDSSSSTSLSGSDKFWWSPFWIEFKFPLFPPLMLPIFAGPLLFDPKIHPWQRKNERKNRNKVRIRKILVKSSNLPSK